MLVQTGGRGVTKRNKGRLHVGVRWSGLQGTAWVSLLGNSRLTIWEGAVWVPPGDVTMSRSEMRESGGQEEQHGPDLRQGAVWAPSPGLPPRVAGAVV